MKPCSYLQFLLASMFAILACRDMRTTIKVGSAMK